MTGTITLLFDTDDRHERAEAAAIVRGDTERLRGALWALSERLRRVSRGKEEYDHLTGYGADLVLAWLGEELDGLPLSLED